MRNVFKKFTQIVESLNLDWKQDYINKSEDLPDLERRMKIAEETEQQQAQMRIRCKI